jgi:hypothetical protein
VQEISKCEIYQTPWKLATFKTVGFNVPGKLVHSKAWEVGCSGLSHSFLFLFGKIDSLRGARGPWSIDRLIHFQGKLERYTTKNQGLGPKNLTIIAIPRIS